MHVLNIMSAVLEGFFNRNELSRRLLDTYAQEFSGMEGLVRDLEVAAGVWHELEIPRGSYWNNKANFFSIMVSVARAVRDGRAVNSGKLRAALDEFESKLPDEYAQAARDSVNNSAQRETRNQFIAPLVDASTA